MSTPTEEYSNPFVDPRSTAQMSDSPKHSPDSSGLAKSAEGGTPANGLNDGDKPKGKKRVGFTGGTASEGPSQRASFVESSLDGTYSPCSESPNYGSPDISGANTPPQDHTRNSSGDLLPQSASKSHLPELSQQQTEQLRDSLHRSLDVPRPRPALRRGGSTSKAVESEDAIEGPDDGSRAVRQASAREAFERGKKLERDELIHSAPGSRRSSPTRNRGPSLRLDDIPLKDFNDEKDEVSDKEDDHLPPLQRQRKASHAEAFNLVRTHTSARDALHSKGSPIDTPGTRSGAATPTEEQKYFMEDYKPKPKEYRGGILGSLLKLYHNDPQAGGHGMPKAHLRTGSAGGHSALSSPAHSPPSSGTTTPTSHWYSYKNKNQSNSSLATLIGSSSAFGSPAVSGLGEQVTQRLKEQQEQAKRPGMGKRSRSSGAIAALNRMSKPRLHEEHKITAHIAETITRQKYLLRLCKALMQYGAPTHRLEEYMMMSARVLETEAQFLYIPGAMIVSFEDRNTHTSEVKLVKVAQGLDLGKLRDVHEIYKEVVHDRLGAEEGINRLKEVTARKPKYNRLCRLPVYGLAAACVGPFAFGARLIDLPISFLLGCILGVLQLYVAPASDLYANVFEIAASVITSFLARAFGSIRGGELFCFSALAQSSIALILPGYTVLCASLELQSRQIVAGSVRMVYAIIYSLFLGFGITVGTAIYGLMDSNATSKTECSAAIPKYWFFFFVPAFTVCLIIINQAKWKQAPVMMIIAFTGYVVNYFSAERFAGNTQISNTLGALVVGVMANLYSRIGGKLENRMWDIWEDRLRPRWKALRKRVFKHQSRKTSAKVLEEGSQSNDTESVMSTFKPATRRVGYGLAAAAMLPAIFVQVPSGLAVNGSLVAGIASADQITGNATNGTTVLNSSTIANAAESLNPVAFTVGYSVIQVAIGITVGLFLSAIVVYPFGKRRSGLFSF